MEAKELRIGNYVNLISDGHEHEPDTFQWSIDDYEYYETSMFNILPIPLTEESLLRFKEVEKKNFDSEETGYGVEYHIKINENLIMNIQDDMSFCLESISDDSKYVYLENDFLDTVHFLQNIYNVLTKGKELTIK
jgi:hypothetical protein